MKKIVDMPKNAKWVKCPCDVRGCAYTDLVVNGNFAYGVVAHTIGFERARFMWEARYRGRKRNKLQNGYAQTIEHAKTCAIAVYRGLDIPEET